MTDDTLESFHKWLRESLPDRKVAAMSARKFEEKKIPFANLKEDTLESLHERLHDRSQLIEMLKVRSVRL